MRQRLLTSTLQLLERHPERRPTTAELARTAHVSIGTVYRYFADMDAIVEELRLNAVRDITASLAGGIGRAMDREPLAAMITVVDTLVSAFESHAAVLRAALELQNIGFGEAWAEVERPLLPLARVLPSRLRPDLDDAAIDDLVFLTMGATASLCLRIALLRPPETDRGELIATAARMLLAAFDTPEAS
ncbi:TetR/AcrR family transcriptional regulator [Gordonia paraffinivorans]|uniref:Bacterial regulatory proteins, tetR family n=1 Tax=Gordonia paraffinivorans TaxID=175628 RepID=A0ABD7V532_9ACTN|nr:TetR/AcrR family transcriptional regulator [Gordonia paraffinivorans]VFA89365.1 Bacterial regulatory proteins, tetR family [Gordonia paraffinivorans]